MSLLWDEPTNGWAHVFQRVVHTPTLPVVETESKLSREEKTTTEITCAAEQQRALDTFFE